MDLLKGGAGGGGLTPGVTPILGGINQAILFDNAGTLGESANLTWNGFDLFSTSFVSRTDIGGAYFTINDSAINSLGAFTTPFAWFGGGASATNIAFVAEHTFQFFPDNGITSVLDISNAGGVASTLKISAPLFNLPDTTSNSIGILNINSTPFFHVYPGTASHDLYIGGGNFTHTGTYTIGIGEGSLVSQTNSVFNIGIGYNALNLSTSGSNNIGIGVFTLANNLTGLSNVAIGPLSLRNIVSSYNVAIGDSAGTGASGASPTNCVFVGYSAGTSVTTAGDNVAIGYNSLFNMTSANANMCLGSVAGYDITTGSANICVGYNSGRGITIGTQNTIIGSNITGLPAGLSNSIIIADGIGNIRVDYNYTISSPATWNFSSRIAIPGGTTPVLTTTTAVTSGAGALVGTLTNSPVTGNPTKWIPFNDNGTTRYIPAW